MATPSGITLINNFVAIEPDNTITSPSPYFKSGVVRQISSAVDQVSLGWIVLYDSREGAPLTQGSDSYIIIDQKYIRFNYLPV